jgi:predicted Zn-dependent protease with MMP-like domain
MFECFFKYPQRCNQFPSRKSARFVADDMITREPAQIGQALDDGFAQRLPVQIVGNDRHCPRRRLRVGARETQKHSHARDSASPNLLVCLAPLLHLIDTGIAVNHPEIRKEVIAILDRLPKRFREGLRNVEIVVEKRPSAELLRAEGLDPRRDTLYGLYQGVPLPERSQFDLPMLPDKITIFSEPLLEDFPDHEELRSEIRLTVLHEIAHYFGINEAEIADLGY